MVRGGSSFFQVIEVTDIDINLDCSWALVSHWQHLKLYDSMVPDGSPEHSNQDSQIVSEVAWPFGIMAISDSPDPSLLTTLGGAGPMGINMECV